jgi:hypothetical protein
MVLALQDKMRLIGPGAWGGVSALIPPVALLALSVMAIGRRVRKRSPANSGRARLAAWLAALLATVAAATLVAGVAATVEVSEMVLLFGFVPWTRLGAAAGSLAGLAGAVAVVLTARARLKHRLPIVALLGYLLTGGAAISLSAFLLYWDLGPL